MSEDLPTVTHTSEFDLFGVKVRCHVLSDGRRVFDKDDFHALLDALFNSETPMTEEEAAQAARFVHGVQVN